MDLTVKGRGIRITDQIRRAVEHKLGKLERFDPRVQRVEVEIIGALNPRMGASHQVEVACDRGRRTFRATGIGKDVESALDQVVERLERQLSKYRGKFRGRLFRRGNRLQSPRTSTEESGISE